MIPTPELPSIITWCTFVTIATEPFGTCAISSIPSIKWIDHNGLRKSNGALNNLEVKYLKVSQFEGSGNFTRFKCKSISKLGSSTQYG